MKFAVESWSPEYGVSVNEATLDDGASPVDVEVEVSALSWIGVIPKVQRLADRIVFVDGVRRIDARIWVTDRGEARQGVCASVAAGAVLCTPDRAEILDPSCSEAMSSPSGLHGSPELPGETGPRIFRGFFSGPLAEGVDIATAHGSYVHVACAGDSPEELYLGIHHQMTSLELGIWTPETAGAIDADLVLFDGPLRGRPAANPTESTLERSGQGVGYIKTQHVQYLPDELQSVVAGLNPGERSPLFLISGSGLSRYSWYLRLPGKQTFPMAAIVRCEIAAVGSVDRAVECANQVTLALPRYASEPHKDSRSPQNLYPIAGLERRLRHLLGDQYVLERALRNASS